MPSPSGQDNQEVTTVQVTKLLIKFLNFANNLYTFTLPVKNNQPGDERNRKRKTVEIVEPTPTPEEPSQLEESRERPILDRSDSNKIEKKRKSFKTLRFYPEPNVKKLRFYLASNESNEEPKTERLTAAIEEFLTNDKIGIGEDSTRKSLTDDSLKVRCEWNNSSILVNQSSA